MAMAMPPSWSTTGLHALCLWSSGVMATPPPPAVHIGADHRCVGSGASAAAVQTAHTAPASRHHHRHMLAIRQRQVRQSQTFCLVCLDVAWPIASTLIVSTLLAFAMPSMTPLLAASSSLPEACASGAVRIASRAPLAPSGLRRLRASRTSSTNFTRSAHRRWAAPFASL